MCFLISGGCRAAYREELEIINIKYKRQIQQKGNLQYLRNNAGRGVLMYKNNGWGRGKESHDAEWSGVSSTESI